MNRRLFLGFSLSSQVNKTVGDILNLIRSKIESLPQKNQWNISWTPPINFHITIKFLGATDEKLIPALTLSLKNLISQYPIIDVITKDIGAFPHFASPRIIWVRILDNSKTLEKLHHDIDLTLEQFGFLKENRTFSPHLTIGRVKHGKNLGPIISPIKEQVFGPSQIHKIILYESRQEKSGTLYYQLESFPLNSNL